MDIGPYGCLAQRAQEATWTLDGTPIGWRSGNGGERAGRSRERRNGWGALKQARGPRRYSRGLIDAGYFTFRPAPSVPGGPPAGQGRRLAARMLRYCLLTG